MAIFFLLSRHFMVLLKLYKMADVITSYLVKAKLWDHKRRENEYKDVFDEDEKAGNISLIGRILLVLIHGFHIGE